MMKYGYYSARSLISLFDVELPPSLDTYKNFELIPLLKIIMARFNRRRQKLNIFKTIKINFFFFFFFFYFELYAIIFVELFLISTSW